LAIAVAVIAAMGGAITAVVTHLLARRKIEAIHVLVNARLASALAEIEELRLELRDERRREP